MTLYYAIKVMDPGLKLYAYCGLLTTYLHVSVNHGVLSFKFTSCTEVFANAQIKTVTIIFSPFDMEIINIGKKHEFIMFGYLLIRPPFQ